jgi:hypothetical protein
MSDQIELHDSCVAVERDNRMIVLRLCPAYVHHWDQVDGAWIGEGRRQAAELMLNDGTMDRDIEGARDVSDGWLEVGGKRYENILPVPLSILGTARGKLELVGAPPIEFSARGVVIRLIGEPEFVEVLSAEWAPNVDAG